MGASHKLTVRMDSASPAQLCANSVIVDFDSDEVRYAMHMPAHRAPASFE